jgi:hypothetical protein
VAHHQGHRRYPATHALFSNGHEFSIQDSLLSRGCGDKNEGAVWAGESIFQVLWRSDALFGGYYSQDYFGCRLKLNVRPAVRLNSGEMLIAFDFNFHRALQQETADRPSMRCLVIGKRPETWLVKSLRLRSNQMDFDFDLADETDQDTAADSGTWSSNVRHR